MSLMLTVAWKLTLFDIEILIDSWKLALFNSVIFTDSLALFVSVRMVIIIIIYFFFSVKSCPFAGVSSIYVILYKWYKMGFFIRLTLPVLLWVELN